jgi:hypothetical protein
MMGGLKCDQGQLFYEFRLGDAVPEDHLVRKIDQAGAACGRYRLRGGSDAELAGRGGGYRATYSGERQVEAEDGSFSRSDFRYDPANDV